MADENPKVENAELEDLAGAGQVAPKGPDLELIRDIQVRLTVELGRTDMLIQEVMELTPGQVIELDKLAGEWLDIRVNGMLLAQGEVVVVDENFGIRITSIIDPRSRVQAMGGRNVQNGTDAQPELEPEPKPEETE